MNRIFLSGDIHGELEYGRVVNYFEDLALYDEDLSKDDYLIILGDAGIVWDGGAADRKVQQALRDLPVTTLWLDGNHENFDLLEEYPEDIWHGGRVQYIDDSIIHLMRGQIYEIGGKTFFVFGGGITIDMNLRTEHIDWWADEMPTDAEYEEGLRNLEKAGDKVDYILTHTCPESIAYEMESDIHPGETPLQKYLEMISESVDFEEWYFAHWHRDEHMGNFHCLYYELIELE